MLQKLVQFIVMQVIKFGQLPTSPSLSPSTSPPEHSEPWLYYIQLQGSSCFSHPPLLQFETHAGKERKGSLWEERWKNHTHCEATIPSCLHVVKHPERQGVCWDSFQYIHTHWSKYSWVSYCLTHSDCGINHFLDHPGGKTNKGKCLESQALMLENKEGK